MEKRDQKQIFALKLINQMNFFLDCLIDAEFFDEKSIRNYRLKLRYNELVFNDVTGKQAREICSNEFYLSDKTIQKIIYDLGKKKHAD